MKNNFKVAWFTIALLMCLMIADRTFSQGDIVVSPVIIEEEARARDILEFSLKITNQGTAKVNVYPLVNDISIEEGKQEFLPSSLSDKARSLTSWIRLSRGAIELWPSEQKEVPFSVNVNLNVKPGKYYAVITLAQGATRLEAEERALKFNQPQILISLEVKEEEGGMQVKQFQTESKVYLKPAVKFLLSIENTGRKAITASGIISIYNKRGEEVGSIEVNPQDTVIESLKTGLLSYAWQGAGDWGRHQARLTLTYGQDKRAWQETIYFWFFPWQLLIFFSGALLFVGLGLVLLIFKKLKKYRSQATSSKIIDLSSVSER